MSPPDTDNLAPYEALRPLMRRFGATGSPRDFYWAVNSAYHTVESAQYEQLHAEMFHELRPIWQRLVRSLPATPQKLRVLDVGSGTGLVAETLNRLCPDRIATLHSLDPCSAMIDRQKSRQQSWSFNVQYLQGEIDAVPPDSRFDVITINSVLHHVVELEKFCNRIAALLAPGGVLLTAQDAPATAEQDSLLSHRSQEATQRRNARAPLLSNIRRMVPRWIKRLLRKEIGSDIADSTSAPLLQNKIITRPMDAPSIWAVTDFHVPGQPGGFGHGIAFDQLARWLHPCQPLDLFTYRFRKLPLQMLDPDELAQEMQWLDSTDMHGALFAAAWRRPGDSPT